MTFDEFAAARLAPALRFATVLTGDPASAEDIVQELMIRVHDWWTVIGQVTPDHAAVLADRAELIAELGRPRMLC